MSQYQRPGENATALDWALWYAAIGWAVFPVHSVKNGICTCREGRECRAPGKHPRTKNGVKAATTDRSKIRRWWKAHPEDNVGIATGQVSRIVVIDVDIRNGGQDSLKNLEQRLGKLPSSPTTKTGGGGWHLVLRCPGGHVRSRQGIAKGIDIQASGKHIVVEPSVHKSGNTYTWQVPPDEVEPPEIPEKWLDWLTGGKCNTEFTECAESTEISGIGRKAQECCGGSSTKNADDLHSLEDAVRDAIDKTIPTAPGQRWSRVFELVRRLKAIPDLTDKPADEHRHVFQAWHERAWPNTSQTHNVEESWADFIFAWEEAQYPWGTDSMVEAFQEAIKTEPPERAVKLYGRNSVRTQLVQLCRELQRRAGDDVFFLTGRKAAPFLQVSDTHAWRWLHGTLPKDGFLDIVRKYPRRMRLATEFRYIGGD